MVTVSEALEQRISTRQFKSTPLGEGLVREILDTARWAPSGGNVQPWKVIAVAGAERQAVSDLAYRALAQSPEGEEGKHPVYPPNLWEPYRSRRYKLGEDMYALLGIGRDEKQRRIEWVSRNFQFFGAPVGLFFVIEEAMGHGQWAHLGMLMQSIALAAQERGVASCMQEAWARCRKSLKTHFGLADNELIYCGMALGYADETAAVNRLRSERISLDELASFRGF